MGIEQNIVTLCHRCHRAFDGGSSMKELQPLGFQSRQDIKEYICAYMEREYPGWKPESVVYKKWSKEDAE